MPNATFFSPLLISMITGPEDISPNKILCHCLQSNLAMADGVASELHTHIFPLWAVLPLISTYSVQLVISEPCILELFICGL